MALHTGNWTQWSWPFGLVWLNRISAWVRPVTRRTATGALRPLLARSERILAVCETAGDNSPAVAYTRALCYRGDDNVDE